MKICGTIKKIFPVVQPSSTVKKQIIWLHIPHDKYPQTLDIEFLNKSIDQLKDTKEGEEVYVEIDLRGREYNDKIFKSIIGYTVTPVPQAKPELMTTQRQIHEKNAGMDIPY